VFHFGFQRSVTVAGGIRKTENVIQYDAGANEDPKQQGFGFNKLAEYVDTVSPDIVMIYNDPIVVNQFLESIKDVPKTFKLWIYLDLVFKGADQGLLRTIESRADRIFCFTQKWKDYLMTRIPTTDKIIDVMEHGVDTQIYNRVSDTERIGIRKQLNVPADGIVFLNMNRNSERKRLDLSIMAFARLVQKNPDLPLYIVFVTGMSPTSGAFYNPIQIWLNEIEVLKLDSLKYGGRVICVDTNRQLFDDKSINGIYNACDYGINTSNGEGFGLCQLEHLATGAPQVVIDVGDYQSFMTPAVSEIIPATEYSYLAMSAGIGSIAQTAPVADIVAAMDRILSNTDKDECIRVAGTRPWYRICDQFLELVATHNNANV
jgi:glycosyltransferase involved in cell wall biosynthesis